MCVEVKVDGKYCNTVAQLRAAMNPANIIADENYKELKEDCCLCQVDIEETAKNNGYECDQEGMMQYNFNKTQ